MKKKLSPSMMCADIFELDECIRTFERCGVDMLHIDVMDGHFVPNYTLGTDYIKALKEKTKIPLDIHLMIDEPENKLDWFAFGEGDTVSVHTESTKHIHKALYNIRSRGAKAFAAVNPGTGTESLSDVADLLSGVLVMTVDPGFAGQRMTARSLLKIEKTRKWLDSIGLNDAEIEVDGNVSFENAEKMALAGANIFVAGTSSVFNKNMAAESAIALLREKIGYTEKAL